MHDLSPLLQQSIIFFTYTTTVILVVVSVFLIKLLVELSKLTKDSQELVTLVKEEVEPTIVELQKALKNVNAIASTADEKVEALKNNVSSIINPLQSHLAKIKLSILQGISKGMDLFLKK